MKSLRWNSAKNEELLAQRGVWFEQVVVAIESAGLLVVLTHPNARRYPRQRVMVVTWDSYACLVPYVEEPEHYFLRTGIPSRKATRDSLQTRHSHEPD